MSVFDDLFTPTPVLGIYRGLSLEETLEKCTAAWDAGVRAVEIPVQSDEAFDILAAAAELGRERGAVVGAGTVRTPAQMERAQSAGAVFTVAPGVDADLIRFAADLGIDHLPGVATATDIDVALRAGVTWVKAFPASVLGPEWVTAHRAPFPEAKFVATGGIHADNARTFLDAGCRAVALGSALADDDQLARLRAAGVLSR